MVVRQVTQLTVAQRIAWLQLFRTENIGPVTFRQLINRFCTAEAALEALPSLLQRTGKPVRITTRSEAEDELAGLARYGAELIVEPESCYPDYLRHIPQSPPLITVVGGKNLDWRRTVGIVGARNASAAGMKMTRLLANELGQRGYTVVSGLARGIDSAAHQASLTTGTVAVLAGGIDRIYPDENIPLAHDILDNGGALMSEMPLGWQPKARDFPRRNRLVSGLSLGIVVVEAAKRSGSLITARLAMEQNRDVFAVPGSPLDPRAEGGNALIQQGAKLITSADDIIESLGRADPGRSVLFDNDWVPENIPDAPPPGTDEREALLAMLSATPIDVDELVRQSGLTASTMQMLLLELDLAGNIEWSGGQMVALRYR